MVVVVPLGGGGAPGWCLWVVPLGGGAPGYPWVVPQRFNTDEEVKEAVSKFIDGLAAEFFEEGFQKWITRQKKCVEKSGDYVEK